MGIDPGTFWGLEPAEFRILQAAYLEKKKHEHEHEISMVYLGAVLHRMKRMPSLKSLLKPVEEKRKKTAEDMLAVVKQLNQAFGGRVERGGD